MFIAKHFEALKNVRNKNFWFTYSHVDHPALLLKNKIFIFYIFDDTIFGIALVENILHNESLSRVCLTKFN